MKSSWNKAVPIDDERQAVEHTLTSVEGYRQFAANNPKFKALPDGRVMQQITEAEWIERATADNASDRPMARQSVMSGWKLAETGEMVMKKVGTDTPYTLTDLPKADSKSPT